MRSAIKRAREPRGTDDAGNCWFEDQRHGREPPRATEPPETPHEVRNDSSHDLHVPDSATEKHEHHTDIKTEGSTMKSVFTLLSSPTLSKQLEGHLVENHMDQFVVDCSLQEDLDAVLDDATWPGKVKKIGDLVQSNVSCACLIHPGTTFTTTARPWGSFTGAKTLTRIQLRKCALKLV